MAEKAVERRVRGIVRVTPDVFRLSALPPNTPPTIAQACRLSCEYPPQSLDLFSEALSALQKTYRRSASGKQSWRMLMDNTVKYIVQTYMTTQEAIEHRLSEVRDHAESFGYDVPESVSLGLFALALVNDVLNGDKISDSNVATLILFTSHICPRDMEIRFYIT